MRRDLKKKKGQEVIKNCFWQTASLSIKFYSFILKSKNDPRWNWHGIAQQLRASVLAKDLGLVPRPH